MTGDKGKSPIHQSCQFLKLKLGPDKGESLIASSSNTDRGKSLITSSSHRKRSKYSKKGKTPPTIPPRQTPLTIPQRLVFFQNERSKVLYAMIEHLPSTLSDHIQQLPSTSEAQLVHQINQLYHISPQGSLLVNEPRYSSLRILLFPETPRSQKIWTIENGLCYGLVSDSYRDRIHLFPTLTNASLKLKDLCSMKLYFKFYSTPPVWEDESYLPAQHLVFITEHYNWLRYPDERFLTTPGAKYYDPKEHPIPPTISPLNLRIDQIYTQLHIQRIMETFPEGFHIFHHSPNWIFATNVQGVLNLLVPQFSGSFLHEPRWTSPPWH